MMRPAKILITGVLLLMAFPQGTGVGYTLNPWNRGPVVLSRDLVESYQSLFGETLSAEQRDGFLRVIRFIQADSELTDLRWAAYMLATVRHETSFTWQPVREFGLGRGHRYGVPDPVLGETYYGRGYVQLTWKENYKRAGRYLGRDLVRNPDKTLHPETAYRILSRGMREGWFTGRSLAHYLSESNTDYVNARRIVNGTDQAEKIAAEAEKFEIFLRREPALRQQFLVEGPVHRG